MRSPAARRPSTSGRASTLPNQLGQLQDRGTVRAFITRFGLNPDYSLNLMPELAPVVPLEMPELLYHQGWRRWQGVTTQAAVAAQVGRSQLRVKDANPAANYAGVICVVEKVLCSSNANFQVVADFGYGPNAVDLGTVVNWEFRDGRQTPTAALTDLILSQDTNAAAPTALAVNVFAAANTSVEVPGGPWVLLPGNQMLITNNVVNQPWVTTWIVRFRQLQEQENTP